MSELKAHNINDLSLHDIANCEFYIKADADKVIALLKDKANYNEEGYKIKKQELSDTCRFFEEELRHQKYRRCLAMARWCDDAARLATWDTDYHRCRWYNKWMKLWLELAEKFMDKEAK